MQKAATTQLRRKQSTALEPSELSARKAGAREGGRQNLAVAPLLLDVPGCVKRAAYETTTTTGVQWKWTHKTEAVAAARGNETRQTAQDEANQKARKLIMKGPAGHVASCCRCFHFF